MPDEIATAPPPLTLSTPVQFAPSVGPRRAELLGRLEVQTVADLVKHIPSRYEYHFGHSPIKQLPLDTAATTRGTVVECRWVPGRSSPIGRPGRGGKGRLLAAVEDETGRLDLVFFNARYLVDKVHPGAQVIVTGKTILYNGYRQMANPKIQFLPSDRAESVSDRSGPVAEDNSAKDHGQTAPTVSPDPLADARGSDRYLPIYPATEDLPSSQIERIVQKILPLALPQIEDHLDPGYRAARSLQELGEAYRLLHQPKNDDDVATGRRRLAYDELLFLQLGFAMKRKQTQTELASPPLRYSDAIDAHIRQRFPFELTTDQLHAARQIAADLQRVTPMNRLLQGDVGSGKTVVALYALLMAVASGRQGALMAPTELLAEQHYLSISNMLKGSTVRLALLTGSLTPGERASVLYKVEHGQIDIVIGTHAIISESVRFAELAVVVVDEQHRFGVLQRATIRSKAGEPSVVPHTLVMTATPIPRTLSLTVFGDLDTSTLISMPPGRQPIVTRVVGPGKSDEVYRYAAERIRKGEQAYVVLPAIDESETGLKAVRSHAQMLGQTHFEGLRIAAVHGRLNPLGRERVMDRFRAGKIDVLIATTVIEVGVDVPNASLMIVEHAERFGLAQLHQLRGRVGRGTRKSLCVFIADATTDDATARLDAVAATTDGFKIAEADLKIRGIGEFFGTRQSGLPPLRVADLFQHLDLLQLARRDAQTIVDADPKLTTPQHTLLRKRLAKLYGPAIGLADVG